MNTLILQNTFEPYYAGKARFSAPASAPDPDSVPPQGKSKDILTKRQRVAQLQARLIAARPAKAR